METAGGGGDVCQGVASRGQFSSIRSAGRWQSHSLPALPGGRHAEQLIWLLTREAGQVYSNFELEMEIRVMIARLLLILVAAAAVVLAADPARYDYRVLATSRTSTMEKEMNEAADAGYHFMGVMGGETAVGGKEVVVVMGKDLSTNTTGRKKYKLLATSRTGTMQKEIQQAGDEGFEYLGQTVFESAFGGREVAVILERDADKPARRFQYKLLATTKTSTMQKELQQAGEEGFEFLGMTVGKTAFGGSEIVSFLRKVLE